MPMTSQDITRDIANDSPRQGRLRLRRRAGSRHDRSDRARDRAISGRARRCGRPPRARRAPPPPPAINGNWTGELTQVGSPTPYKFELTINAKGAETKYPDLDCIGKLTRAGSSKTYTFFVEVITKGSADKGGRCPDGTMTVARQGDDLALGWFGSVQGTTVVAYGTLKKK